MISNYTEVPHTIEGLKFYIDRGEIAVKDFTNKINRLKDLLAVAKERLKLIEDAPKKEMMDETI